MVLFHAVSAVWSMQLWLVYPAVWMSVFMLQLACKLAQRTWQSSLQWWQQAAAVLLAACKVLQLQQPQEQVGPGEHLPGVANHKLAETGCPVGPW